MPIFVKLQRWWQLALMELSRWLLVVLFEAHNNNFVCVCASGGLHRSVLFLLLFYYMFTCFCCAFVACAPVLAAPLLCTCSCCASITYTPIFATFMLCICYYCSSIACAFVFVVPLLHVHLFLWCLCCKLVIVAPQLHVHLFLLCCSSCLDPLALLYWFVFQLLTLLHCYHALINSWPSCIIMLCCSLALDLFTLLHCVAS